MTNALLSGLAAALLAMTLIWAASVVLRNAAVVDLFWGPVSALVGSVYWFVTPAPTLRAGIVLLLVWLWALRLGIYLTVRNHGKPEDRRYGAMREHHGDAFWYRSLWRIFWLQAFLAWFCGLPLFGAITGAAPFGILDVLGILLFAFGLVWETAADWQLANFLRERTNKESVMDRGVWRYSRHPNYFGEFCVWWGFWLIATAAGAWWTIVGPALLSFFLLKVSGVAMLEKDISERRPAYADYIRKTSAFFPRPPSD